MQAGEVEHRSAIRHGSSAVQSALGIVQFIVKGLRGIDPYRGVRRAREYDEGGDGGVLRNGCGAVRQPVRCG